MGARVSIYAPIFYTFWLLDAIVTIISVRTGHALELNLFVRDIADSWKLIAVKFLAIPVVIILMKGCPYIRRFYLVGSIIMAVIVVWTLLVMVLF